MFRTMALLGCLVASQPAVAAAQGIDETPEAVAERSLAAIRDGNFLAVASLMHEDALRELRALLEPILTLDDPEVVELRQQLMGESSIPAIRGMSDTLFVSRFLGLAMNREGMAQALKSSQGKLLGSVKEGPDTVHVVYRLALSVEDIAITEMDVISLGRSRAGWRTLLKGDVRAMASALQGLMKRS